MLKLPKLFEKKNDKTVSKNNSENFVEVFSPLDGEIIDLSQIPDATFASGAIGDGVGIIPNENSNTLFSPCDSNYMSIFDTGHAISFDLKGFELIIHIGVGTVKFKGKGFKKIACDGAVKINSEILKYDLKFIKENAKSEKTAIVIANMEKVSRIEKMKGQVKAGDLLMKVYYSQ